MTKSLLQRNVQPTSDVGDATKSNELTVASASAEEPESTLSTRRAGDSGVGRPSPKKRVVETKDPSSATAREIPINDDVGGDDPIAPSIYAPTWICKALRVGLLFISAVAVFFIVTQTASFLANVRQLSLLEQILLSIPLAIFGGIILGIIVKILLLLRKLRVSPQIKIKALQELEDRKSLRRLCLKSNRDAVEKLCAFLKGSFDKNGEELRTLGGDGETVKSLIKRRDMLIQEAENPSGTSQAWIADFRQFIQDPLDKIAQKRILRYSMNTAIMTGISPFSLIDRLIVFSACLSMLKELMQLYSLKPSWDKNFILMGQVIVNTYLAGVIEDVAEAGIDGLTDLAGDTVSQIPDYALRWAGKTAETATQGYMVYRLGKAAIRVLHPVRVPQDESRFSSFMTSAILQKKG